MIELNKEEAEKKSIELLELLLSIHHETNFSSETDDKLLKIIHTMLKERKEEERDIRETTFDLYMTYAQLQYSDILEFVEDCENTFIDFGKTSEILNRAKRLMESTQINESDLKSIIREMNIEYNRLNDREEDIKKEGFRKFIKRAFLPIFGIEVTLFLGVGYLNIIKFSVLSFGTYLYRLLYNIVHF